MAGPEPISPSGVRDWADLTRTDISREEFSMILRMDSMYRLAWSEEAENNMKIQSGQWEYQND